MTADGMDVDAWNAANPLHPRAGDGKFRDRLASAVRNIAASWGEMVNHEDFGEPDHDFNDHGIMALHDDGWISLSRVDIAADHDPSDQDSHSGSIANLDSQDALVLQERVELAVEALRDMKPGQHGDMDDDDTEDPFPVSVSYGVLSGGQGYVALTDMREEDGHGIQLSPGAAEDFAEQLGTMRDQQGAYERDKDNPYIIRPLPADETLLRRKKISSESNDDVLLAIVDTSTGRRLRFGLGGGEHLPEKSFTGGPGPMVADLGPDEVRRFDGAMESVLDELGVYEDNQQALAEHLDEWEQTPTGQEWENLHQQYYVYRGSSEGHPGGLHVTMRGPDGKRMPEAERADAPGEVYERYRELSEEVDRMYEDFAVINDEGVEFARHEIETRAGTIVVALYGWDPSTPPDVRISVRPHGVSADDEDWGDIERQYDAYAQMTPRELKKLRKLVADAFLDAQGNPVTKSARGTAGRVDNDRIAREGRKYWTRDPEGLAKWARSAHPWTALHRHLATKMDPETADRLTSSYFRAVFGYAPSARQGKNPVGKG